MAGYFMHIYFANRITEKLPIGSSSVIKLYPDAFRLGVLGSDLLFPIQRTEAEMDVADAFTLFENTADYIFGSGSKCQLSYMLGMVVHYLLDSRINPYFYYLAENGVPHYYDSQKTSLECDQIADGLDFYYLNAHLRDKKDEILSFKPRKDVVLDIASLYSHVISTIIGHSIDEDKIISCLAKPLFKELESIDMLTLDIANTKNRSWKTVRNGEWSTNMSIEELLDKIEPIAIKMIADYMDRARSGVELNKKAFRINTLGVLTDK